MYTLLNSTNSILNLTTNESENNGFTYSSISPTLDKLSSIFLILILSVLCFLGVIFMIFGPMMRSEAWKRVDNYIFGQEMGEDDRDDGGADGGD